MDTLTIGFILAVVIFMLIKLLFELYMYKNSMYEILYSSFTEYRMRKKSIEGMSESYLLKEVFGPHRILYHILQQGHSAGRAFATVILTSGCYTIAVNSERKNIMVEVKSFMRQHITDQLKNTVYQSVSFQSDIFVIRSNGAKDSAVDGEKSKGHLISRKDLLGEMEKRHHLKKHSLSKVDIDGIFYTLAQDSIDNETVSVKDLA